MVEPCKNTQGGIITENTVNGAGNGYPYGGGIHITGSSTVTMSGGIISKNTANGFRSTGGGVYVENGSSFIKRSTFGNSSSGVIYGGAGDNGNYTLSGWNENRKSGHTVYRNWGSLRQRNTTLGGYDEISTGNDEGWE